MPGIQFLVAPDIFGHTPHLDDLLTASRCDFSVVCPYDGKAPEFESEAEAYRNFMNNVGLDSYSQKLSSRITGTRRSTILLGFSVGASVVWRTCARQLNANVERAICFYGSQIRHEIHLHPVVPLSMILPESEAAFDVEELASAVRSKQNVSVEMTSGRHGFMNRLSPNFDQTLYDQFTQQSFQ